MTITLDQLNENLLFKIKDYLTFSQNNNVQLCCHKFYKIFFNTLNILNCKSPQITKSNLNCSLYKHIINPNNNHRVESSRTEIDTISIQIDKSPIQFMQYEQSQLWYLASDLIDASRILHFIDFEKNLTQNIDASKINLFRKIGNYLLTTDDEFIWIWKLEDHKIFKKIEFQNATCLDFKESIISIGSQEGRIIFLNTDFKVLYNANLPEKVKILKIDVAEASNDRFDFKANYQDEESHYHITHFHTYNYKINKSADLFNFYENNKIRTIDFQTYSFNLRYSINGKDCSVSNFFHYNQAFNQKIIKFDRVSFCINTDTYLGYTSLENHDLFSIRGCWNYYDYELDKNREEKITQIFRFQNAFAYANQNSIKNLNTLRIYLIKEDLVE